MDSLAPVKSSSRKRLWYTTASYSGKNFAALQRCSEHKLYSSFDHKARPKRKQPNVLWATFIMEESVSKCNPPVDSLSKRANLSIMLASRFIEFIEDSGAAQIEVLAALGIVQSLLPTLGISAVIEDDAAPLGVQLGS